MKKIIHEANQGNNEKILLTEDYKSNNSLLTALFNYSIRLSYVPFSENILMIAANELKNIFNVLGVTISLYDYETSDLILKYSTFSENQKSRFAEIFGLRLEGMRFKVTEEIYKSITSDRYVIVGSLHEITLGTINPLIGSLIEKVFGVGWFAGISLQDKNRLIGTAALVGKKNTTSPSEDVIKGFAAVTANALSRWITEQKALVNELRYKVWAENMKDILWQTDSEQKLIYVSPSGFKILGYQPEEMLDKGFLGFFTENSARLIMRTIKMRENKKLKNNELSKNITYEVQVVHKTGRYIWTEIIASPLYDSFGNLTGFQGIARDISERKEAEMKIRQQVEDLKRINAEKDKFFSIIAHDLKGLLHGFVGYTKFIAERINTLSQEKLAEYSSTICNTAINLNELLGNLLEWSMIQQNRIQFSPKDCDLRTIIEKNIKTFEQQARNKEISIISPNLTELMVFIDYHMINTVIRNILSNAIKFTPHKGRIEIIVNRSSRFVEIVIQDSGIGMDEITLKSIFKIDSLISTPGTDGEPSSGLGLILCKEYIAKHNGKIWIDSVLDKGTCVHITIPIKQTQLR